MLNRPRIVLAIGAYLCFACQAGKEQGTAISPANVPQFLTLSSGQRIEILGVWDEPEGKRIMIEYFTELEYEALQREVREIWNHFRPYAEQAGATTVIIGAMEAPATGIDFSLYRNDDGSWRESGGFFPYPHSNDESTQ